MMASVRVPRRGAPSDIARRSLENPNIPITADQLVSVLEMGTSHAGVTVNATRAATHATVISCVKILAETLAMLPLKVYRRLDRGRKVADEHPAYALLHDRPNPELPSFVFREVLQAHLGLWGNAYAEIEMDGAGRALALWPIAPWKAQVVRENGQKRYRVTLDSGERLSLSADRVMHIPGFGYDGLQGVSPIGAIKNTVGLSMATEDFGAKWFANGARPTGIITRPREVPALSPTAAKAFKESWELAHQGIPNAHRVALLEEGMQWQQIGIPPDDSQFLETRLFQKREIAGWYRVPLHMLGDLERATFSNIEQQGIDFVTHTMGPWLSRWEAVMNYDLFSDRDRARYYAEFLTTALLRGDSAARAAYYTALFNVGAKSPNDIRDDENENPIEGGDRYFVQGAYAPLDRIDEIIAKQAKPAPGDPAQPTPEPAPKDPKAPARALFRDVGERMAKRQAEQLRKLHKKGESEWKLGLSAHFSEHSDAISRSLKATCEALSVPALAAIIAESEVAATRHLFANADYAEVGELLATWEENQASIFTANALGTLEQRAA